MTETLPKIFCAIDTPDLDQAVSLIRALSAAGCGGGALPAAAPRIAVPDRGPPGRHRDHFPQHQSQAPGQDCAQGRWPPGHGTAGFHGG